MRGGGEGARVGRLIVLDHLPYLRSPLESTTPDCTLVHISSSQYAADTYEHSCLCRLHRVRGRVVCHLGRWPPGTRCLDCPPL